WSLWSRSACPAAARSTANRRSLPTVPRRPRGAGAPPGPSPGARSTRRATIPIDQVGSRKGTPQSIDNPPAATPGGRRSAMPCCCMGTRSSWAIALLRRLPLRRPSREGSEFILQGLVDQGKEVLGPAQAAGLLPEAGGLVADDEDIRMAFPVVDALPQ